MNDHYWGMLERGAHAGQIRQARNHLVPMVVDKRRAASALTISTPAC